MSLRDRHGDGTRSQTSGAPAEGTMTREPVRIELLGGFRAPVGTKTIEESGWRAGDVSPQTRAGHEGDLQQPAPNLSSRPSHPRAGHFYWPSLPIAVCTAVDPLIRWPASRANGRDPGMRRGEIEVTTYRGFNITAYRYSEGCAGEAVDQHGGAYDEAADHPHLL